MLGIMTLMPGICFAQDADSTVMNRVWNYYRNFSQPVAGLHQNVYMRYSFSTERRNPTLFLVPTMYVIAKGERQFIGESYGKMVFRDIDDYDLQRQVVCGTIHRQRMAMPALLESMTPKLYDTTIYPEHLLSPFNRSNRNYYRYKVNVAEGGLAVIHFAPRHVNTQLVRGHAVVDNTTGRLQSVQFSGEFDMISFKVDALMNMQNPQLPLPERCSTTASFRFLGNRISSHFLTVYNCPETLPDSLDEKEDCQLMSRLRPVPLTPDDQHIYRQHDEMQRQEQLREAADTTAVSKDWDWVREVGWNIIGDNLINGHKTSAGPLTMRVSPLLNPLYLGYSHSNGISYRLNLGLRYSWNTHRYLTLDPRLGYNFKQRQFYYTIPLRMTYNPKRNGYAEIKWGNGNHISNAALVDDFHRAMGDSVEMPNYKDEYVQVSNNVVAFDWLEIGTALVYHERESITPRLMHEAGLTAEFRSFAPSLTLRLTPWFNGPTLTANYERALKDVFRSNLDYERWEFDAAYLYRMNSMRILNMRAGCGFYTQRNSNYFVDFTNFHDNNLPTGWEDDWSGQFQLLNSSWYNASNYYVRGHLSYDSPMMMLYRLPLVGRYIETERIYVSALSIAHTRPYFELGYGFSNRYLSAALFTSLLNYKLQKVGFKVTIQIFNRW
ncbi:MAG: hypothetical protein II822_11015 [Prevotella sp.]|nr:hypothetical protein [Prevotella sp.]